MRLKNLKNPTRLALILTFFVLSTAFIFKHSNRKIHELENSDPKSVTVNAVLNPEKNNSNYVIQIKPEQLEKYIDYLGTFPKPALKFSRAMPTPQTGSSLPKFNPKTDLMAFIHIGKNGGTSFDKTMKITTSKLKLEYCGNKHFDWTYIEKLNFNSKKTVKPVVLLRDPVDRVISHFYFHLVMFKSRFEGFTDIDDYFGNPEIMLKTRDIWQDGQGAVSWLSGTHIANWVVKGLTHEMIENREKETILEAETVMLRAAENLRGEVAWFGFLEDQARGFEMLEDQLKISENERNFAENENDKNTEKITFKWSNKNSKNTGKVTPETRKFIEKLIPQDLWFHKYAKSLFEARYNFMKTGIWEEPIIPKLPILHCKSTRFILRCDNPAIYHQLNWNEKKMDESQRELLPKFDDKLLFHAFSETV